MMFKAPFQAKRIDINRWRDSLEYFKSPPKSDFYSAAESKIKSFNILSISI